jgi:hypothetical protein
MCPFTHQEGTYRGLCLHSVMTSTLIEGDWITSGSDSFTLITLSSRQDASRIGLYLLEKRKISSL